MIVTVVDQRGASHELAAEDGYRLMEVIRDAGLPIAAQCGGCCSCATCHVHVAEAWVDRLSPAAHDEEDLLDLVEDLQPGSRLSCQIIMSPEYDGLCVTLASGTEV
jgi:ferredoxin, 2Fe-2S